MPKMLDLLAERVPDTAEKLRFGVIHVDCAEIAEQAAAAIRERYGDRDILISPATAVIATHTGPGTWGIAYQIED